MCLDYLKFYAGQNQCLRIVLATAEVHPLLSHNPRSTADLQLSLARQVHRYRRLLATLEDVDVCVMGADQAPETEFGGASTTETHSQAG